MLLMLPMLIKMRVDYIAYCHSYYFKLGAFTTVLNNPIDVVKSRMQADSQGGGKSAPEFRSTWHCITAIKERDGLYGLLFRGLSARLVKISTGQAVIFFIYEHAKALTDQFLA
mmetsp:Transcript_12696/g.20329  ORF Transcript_12696/g.20329 Transcript_12696/m.20329 type:complete len:113 (+) Transcript_12696:219-557(+)